MQNAATATQARSCLLSGESGKTDPLAVRPISVGAAFNCGHALFRFTPEGLRIRNCCYDRRRREFADPWNNRYRSTSGILPLPCFDTTLDLPDLLLKSLDPLQPLSHAPQHGGGRLRLQLHHPVLDLANACSWPRRNVAPNS